jgi:zinc/manganese transport system substrate-binding protein
MRRQFLLSILVLISAAGLAQAKVNVVTTTEDLAALVREVGRDHVEVTAVAKGYQDPHFVDAKPSFLLKLSKADLLALVGLDLEIGWLPPLITQSRNAKIQFGAPGYLDASQGVEILERPTGQVTRAMGDVHPLGNPHYWLDPENGRRMARNLAQRLAVLDPPRADSYRANLADFERRLDQAIPRWLEKARAFSGVKVVTYHNSWPNFVRRFGLIVVGYVEPRPGIPPSPSHTLELINTIKSQGAKGILVEPYFDLKTPEAVARASGAQVLVLCPSVGGVKQATDYFKLFDYNLDLLAQSLS